MPIDPLDSTHIIKNFPDAALLDIARNDSAQYDYRLFAVELLHTRKSEKLKHPDIQHLVQDLEIELEGIVFEHPAPGPGPMKAGVTLRTLYGTPEHQFTGFDDVDVLSEPVPAEPIYAVPPEEPTPLSTESKPTYWPHLQTPKEPDAAE